MGPRYQVTASPSCSEQPHSHIRTTRDGDDVLLFPPLSGPKKFSTYLPLDTSPPESVELVMRNFVGFLFPKRALVKQAKRRRK